MVGKQKRILIFIISIGYIARLNDMNAAIERI